jgi:hypothetical protein
MATWLLLLFADAPPVLAASEPTTFTINSFAAIRAHYAGKPLVVHLWGLSCAPCLVELPKLGILRRQRPDLNLVMIQLEPAPNGATTQLLRRAGLSVVEQWQVVAEPDEHLRYSIDPKWLGDLPRTLLISPRGAITRIRGAADMREVANWLRHASG